MCAVKASGADIEIREASASHASAIARIYNHYVEHTVVTFEEAPVSPEEMASRINIIQERGLPWLVGVVAGMPAGYCYASPWKGRSAYRHSVEATIYLDEPSTGRGIGPLLYTSLLKILSERGIHVVIGGAALPNPACVSLHERLGFERVATFRQVGFKLGRWVDVAYWQRIL